MNDAKRTVLADLLACCRAWEPSVRILGNVRAGDAAAAIEDALSEQRAVGEPVAWTNEAGDVEPISDAVKQARPDLYAKGYTRPLFYTAPQASAEAVQEAITALQDAYDNATKVSGSALLAGEVKRKGAREAQSALVYRDACAVLVDIGTALHALKSAPAAEDGKTRDARDYVRGPMKFDAEDSAKGAGEVALPPLPEPVDQLAAEDGFGVVGTQNVYTADQMRAYALADRQQHGGEVDEQLKRRIAAALRDMRSKNYAEARYWLDQWAQIGRAALAAQKADGGDAALLQTLIWNCSACDTRYVQKGEHEGKPRSISLTLRAGENTNPKMQEQLRLILGEFADHCAAISAQQRQEK